MQISSNINNLVNNESKNIKFTDKETSKTISVDLDANTKNKLETSVPNLEHYLQTMYSLYKQDGNIDKNEDGFLDTSEFINAKRFAQPNEKDNKLSFSSLKNVFKNDELALNIAEYMFKNDSYFKDLGATDSKVSISKDFAKFLKVDENLDAQISQKELFFDLEKNSNLNKPLGLILAEFLIEQLKAWAEEKKRKVMNGISSGAFSASLELKEQNKTIDKLLKNNGELGSLTDNEKSIFSSKKDNKTDGNNIDIKELVETKEKLGVLNKYIDTQADNAKIFSLKI